MTRDIIYKCIVEEIHILYPELVVARDVVIGAGGLELDSIDVAEVFCNVEDKCGVQFESESVIVLREKTINEILDILHGEVE